MFRLLPVSIMLLAASTTVVAQTYTVLYNFGNGSGAPADPGGVIAQSRGGAMFSTSANDYGSVQQGKAFRIWPSGSLQVVHQFASGVLPGGFVLGTDGDFYGGTLHGGTSKLGTIFKMTQGGSVTTLHEFTGGSDGEYPSSNPIQSEGGDFYGTTQGPPQGTTGTVYRITKYGNFTVLHVFSGPDGAQPNGELVQGNDLNFYGTTWKGGTSHEGTIFRISSNGDFKVLVNFNGTNGSYPDDGLIQASDGNFYGVTTNGGAGYGVLFRMTPSGALTVLHTFTSGSDGATPVAALIQGSDGNLYGTNMSGGKNNFGVIFRATLNGNVVPLHDFSQAGGCNPFSRLMHHTSGNIYGEMSTCGSFDAGTFYRLNASLRPFVTYLPVYGRAGAEVQILGQGFSNSSKVYFNGTQATNVMEVYPTYIRAEVPQGATTGPITVTTSNGTLKSNKVFVVH